MSGAFEIVLWVLLLIASLTDLLWGKIFNLITFPFLIAGLVCQFWVGGVSAAIQGALAVAVALLLFFPLYYIKTFAAGDVKLLMAAGAWSNPGMVIELGVIAILVGALVGLVFLFRKSGLKLGLQSIGEHLRTKHQVLILSHRMPFAPAFLCAFVFLKIAEVSGWSVL